MSQTCFTHIDDDNCCPNAPYKNSRYCKIHQKEMREYIKMIEKYGHYRIEQDSYL